MQSSRLLRLCPWHCNCRRSPSYRNSLASYQPHSKSLIFYYFPREFIKEVNRKPSYWKTSFVVNSRAACPLFPEDDRGFYKGLHSWAYAVNCARHDTAWPKQVLPQSEKPSQSRPKRSCSRHVRRCTRSTYGWARSSQIFDPPQRTVIYPLKPSGFPGAVGTADSSSTLFHPFSAWPPL